MTRLAIPSPGRARAIIIMMAIAAVSYSIVLSMLNPALEVLRQEMHTDQVGISWVLTGYLLSSAILTPVLGRMGDQLGRNRLLAGALLLLAVGCVIGALAPNLFVLIVARVLQGSGGAVLPLAFGILRAMLPSHRV